MQEAGCKAGPGWLPGTGTYWTSSSLSSYKIVGPNHIFRFLFTLKNPCPPKGWLNIDFSIWIWIKVPLPTSERHALVTPSQLFGLHIWLNSSPYGSLRSSKQKDSLKGKIKNEHRYRWLLFSAFPWGGCLAHFASGEPSLALILQSLPEIRMTGFLVPSLSSVSRLWQNSKLHLRACAWGLNGREFLHSWGTAGLGEF